MIFLIARVCKCVMKRTGPRRAVQGVSDAISSPHQESIRNGCAATTCLPHELLTMLPLVHASCNNQRFSFVTRLKINHLLFFIFIISNFLNEYVQRFLWNSIIKVHDLKLVISCILKLLAEPTAVTRGRKIFYVFFIFLLKFIRSFCMKE